MTPQRLTVLEVIHNADKHISAEEVFDQVRARHPYANISTVYRTLELMEALGLVTGADFGDGRIRYHHSDKGHHHHLVCQKCGNATELEEDLASSFQRRLSRNYGFKANLKHMTIFGLCAACQKE